MSTYISKRNTGRTAASVAPAMNYHSEYHINTSKLFRTAKPHDFVKKTKPLGNWGSLMV